jgi:hypothetical protein
MDIYTAEHLVPEPSLVEVEIAIEKLKSFKSPGTDQILAKVIKAGGETQTYLFHMEYRGVATAVDGIYYCTNS